MNHQVLKTPVALPCLAVLVTMVIASLPASGEPPESLTVRVQVLNFDPPVPSQGKRRLHEVLGFRNPHELAMGYAQDVRGASGGSIDYRIVAWQDVDEIPVKEDGFRYTPDRLVELWHAKGPWHEADRMDYMRVLTEHVEPAEIDEHLVDEVWIFGGPYFGFYESCMAGPRSFAINGGVYPDFPSRRPFAVMGFNYERGEAEMLHNLGHRIEATLTRYYGGWNMERPQTAWDRFTANVVHTKGSGPFGVGNVHFPPNAEKDYDYGNPRMVKSTAPRWKNYPAEEGDLAEVSVATWDPEGRDSHRGFMRWWLSHLPRAEGATEGKLNNWWRYVFDYDNLPLAGGADSSR